MARPNCTCRPYGCHDAATINPLNRPTLVQDTSTIEFCPPDVRRLVKHTRNSFCRICINHCSILVDLDDGVATAIHGNSRNQVYGDYTCVKG
ncbi:hypothetical protein [Rhodococcus jostii]|uniref:hypothetical protein n=1 Tax=Rhodococcus jostii TaxID=132919 RepID=UPI003642E903